MVRIVVGEHASANMANCGITSAEPFLSEISQVAGSGILQSKGKGKTIAVA